MDIFALQRELSATETLDDILRLMKREFGAIGIDLFTYVFQIVETFHTPPCICMTNLDRDFLAYYMENAYFNHDPLMKHFTRSNLPLFYSVDDDWTGYGPETVAFQEGLKEWGFWGGVCLPIFSKEGTRGFLVFSTQSHDSKVIDRAAKASLWIRYFHHHILRIWVEIHPGHTSLRARLTPREMEILLEVADGLTSQEIAVKLDMSQRTVDTHMTSVQVKLQADNRSQALCKAVNLGLLQPDLNYDEHVLWVF